MRWTENGSIPGAVRTLLAPKEATRWFESPKSAPYQGGSPLAPVGTEATR